MVYKISYLLDKEKTNSIKVNEAMEVTNLNWKELRENLDCFQYELSDDTLKIEKVSALEWTKFFLENDAMDYELEIDERQYMIYLMIYSQEENTSVFHFQDIMGVSRGTILSDIKTLREKLAEDAIEISYDRQKGYVLEGNINNMIRNAKNYISRLIESESGKFILHYLVSRTRLSLYAEVKDKISYHISQSNFKYVPSRIDEIIYFTIFSKDILLSNTTEEIEGLDHIKEISIYQTSQDILSSVYSSELSDINAAIYTISLLTILQGNIHEPAFDFLLQLSAEIIHNMEKLAAIKFDDFRSLLFDLYNHLVPAYYRIKYKLYLSNIMLDTIYNEYFSIYNLTEKALLPLEKSTGESIPEEEIGYFTILFGGAINSEDKKVSEVNQLKAMIVCPNGVSSSLILSAELKKLFPSIEYYGADSIDGLKSISKNDYDFIFSTVPIQTDKKVYVVKPIMNQLEKNKLINEIQTDWLLPGISLPNVEEIVSALKPYIALKEGVSREQIYRILNRKLSPNFGEVKNLRLRDLLTKENIQFVKKVKSWEDAIKVAAEPLYLDGSVENSYVEAMIKNIHTYGAYIYLGNGIALPHSAPEDGVNKTGISLLKLEKPVKILNDPAYETQFIFVLAAIDNQEHLDALDDLMRIIDNKDHIESLSEATNEKNILDIIRKSELDD